MHEFREINSRGKQISNRPEFKTTATDGVRRLKINLNCIFEIRETENNFRPHVLNAVFNFDFSFVFCKQQDNDITAKANRLSPISSCVSSVKNL